MEARATPCPLLETELDCLACGACCREVYDTVEVGDEDPFVLLHPELVQDHHGRLNLRREGNRCACLIPGPGTWTCRVYDERPQTCRDFEQGGENCLEARRRLGLSRARPPRSP
jgi:Fe-S-cluster containining protein